MLLAELENKVEQLKARLSSVVDGWLWELQSRELQNEGTQPSTRQKSQALRSQRRHRTLHHWHSQPNNATTLCTAGTPTAAPAAGSIVWLNVGGSKFATSLSTLAAVPGSMLGAMFSGLHTLARDAEHRPRPRAVCSGAAPPARPLSRGASS
eukprot:gnl/Hemi2/8649_TR2997_c0_g1_i1.p1 gnl/Hemi2/8649_TR2997_c0_g1~~gnl/Hemi2/8649_TR2997_c0_g1_i1.p1  ORF type:complete len:152 (+),score=30.01 gnl/Hemi2/8649_TR2997_c0_g1_i1:6-461(+)